MTRMPADLTLRAELATARRLDDLVVLRAAASVRFFAGEADRIARLCHAMAERFERGGRLLALGHAPAACSDARRMAVAFMHPAVDGKRALPAIAISPAAGPLPVQLGLLARPGDVVVVFGAAGDTASAELDAAVAAARAHDCLTIAFAPRAAAWEFVPPTDDPFVHQELVETLAHVVWELVHVFFEHGGLLGAQNEHGRRAEDRVSAGAASSLYPFLGDTAPDVDAVLADVGRSVRAMANDAAELRERTIVEARETLIAAAAALRAALDAGGTLLACGSGGSVTRAMDAVADFRVPLGDWPARRALDLSEDPALLTVLARDVGPDSIFAHQVAAHGQRGDVLLAFSTSADARDVAQALAEARQRGMPTIAFVGDVAGDVVGGDGGQVTGEGLADHVIVTRSRHVPRIHEAQATACHLLRELVELSGEGGGGHG
jgi:D-sedoheptulose 7-phosphate isomerase